MKLHYELTGNPFEINPETITVVWPAMGLEGTDVSRDGDKITCLEDLDEVLDLLKAAGLKFAKIQYFDCDWAFCLVNTDKIRCLEICKEGTKLQVGFDYDGTITLYMPLDEVLDLLAAARR